MAWLKVDQTLRDHHKICDAADALQVDPAHMTGMMILFWLWAIDNAPSGQLGKVSAAAIARGAQYKGDPAEFVEVLKNQHLLDVSEDGVLTIHDWEERAGQLIDRRQKDAARKAAERAAKKAEASEGRPPDVREKSAARVEQSRVEQSRVDIPPSEEEEAAADPAEIPTPFEKIRLLWNEICVSYSKAQGVNGKRKISLEARWRERPDLDWWTKYFTRIEASGFLKGKNPRKWRANFDWVLNAANMDKILEGNYDEEGGGQHEPDTDRRDPQTYARGFKE